MKNTKAKRTAKARSGSLEREVSTRAVNELVAAQITERVAVRVQEMEGRYDEKPGFEMKATIYHEVLEVLNEGVEC